MTRHTSSNCLNLEEPIMNSHVILHTADQTIHAWAIETDSWKPVCTMFPHHAFFIGAGWPRELGTSYISITAGTLSRAVAKPLMSIYKSVAMGIPAAIFSFFASYFKIGCTWTFEQRIWVPTLPYVISVSFFVAATYQKFRKMGDQVVYRA